MYEFMEEIDPVKDREISTNDKLADNECVRDITKLSGYPRSNDKTRLEQLYRRQ